MAAPALESLRIDRLMWMPRLANIVVARDGKELRRETLEKLGAEAKVAVVIGPIDRDVSTVNDEVRPLRLDPRAQRRPSWARSDACADLDECPRFGAHGACIHSRRPADLAPSGATRTIHLDAQSPNCKSSGTENPSR